MTAGAVVDPGLADPSVTRWPTLASEWVPFGPPAAGSAGRPEIRSDGGRGSSGEVTPSLDSPHDEDAAARELAHLLRDAAEEHRLELTHAARADHEEIHLVVLRVVDEDRGGLPLADHRV